MNSNPVHKGLSQVHPIFPEKESRNWGRKERGNNTQTYFGKCKSISGWNSTVCSLGTKVRFGITAPTKVCTCILLECFSFITLKCGLLWSTQLIMPCCLHGYPHPKHGCGSASLSSEYHECSFNSQNTLYNNYWVDAFCLFTELEEATLQRDLFAWACRRQEKTSVRSSRQAPQIFTGRLCQRFWICRKTALGCHLGGQSCVVGMVGSGLPILKVTVAGSVY